MPTTIMIGAGDRPRRLNGALGRAPGDADQECQRAGAGARRAQPPIAVACGGSLSFSAIRTTSDGTITAADAPHRAWAVIIRGGSGTKRHRRLRGPEEKNGNAGSTRRPVAPDPLCAEHDQAGNQHRICGESGSDGRGRNAEAAHHAPSATGKEATWKDMIIWPSAIAIIGSREARAAAAALMLTVDCGAIASFY